MWGAEEFFVVGEPEFEFGDGETAFGQRVAGVEEELGVVVLVARAEAQVGFEMAGKTGRIGEVETFAACVDVLVEGVFVIGWREYRVILLQQAAKLAHGLRLVGVLETEFHLPLAVEFYLQSPTVIPAF